MTSPDSPDIPRPVRTCVGCRKRVTKGELLRVTAVRHDGPSGVTVIVPDPSGAAPGRGAHLHPTTECYDLAVRRKAFARALRLGNTGSGPSSAPVGEYVASLDRLTDEKDRSNGS